MKLSRTGALAAIEVLEEQVLRLRDEYDLREPPHVENVVAHLLGILVAEDILYLPALRLHQGDAIEDILADALRAALRRDRHRLDAARVVLQRLSDQVFQPAPETTDTAPKEPH